MRSLNANQLVLRE